MAYDVRQRGEHKMTVEDVGASESILDQYERTGLTPVLAESWSTSARELAEAKTVLGAKRTGDAAASARLSEARRRLEWFGPLPVTGTENAAMLVAHLATWMPPADAHAIMTPRPAVGWGWFKNSKAHA